LELEAARSYWIQAVQGESFAAEFKALRESLPLPEGSKVARFDPFLDEEGFQTILVGIETTLNSRPIIQDDDNETLTPAHFLTGEKPTTIPHGPEPVRTEDLTRSFRQHQRMAEALWRRWQREYVLQLRTYHEVRRPARQGPKFKVGDIVLLQEERTLRHMWKKARIDELLQGRDGRIRRDSLLLPDRTKIRRPVQLVISVEIGQGGEDVED
jgi:hypothetical protein